MNYLEVALLCGFVAMVKTSNKGRYDNKLQYGGIYYGKLQRLVMLLISSCYVKVCLLIIRAVPYKLSGLSSLSIIKLFVLLKIIYIKVQN